MPVNLIAYAAPIVASLGGWALLGVVVTGRTILGFAVILVGFGLVTRRTLCAEIERFQAQMVRDRVPRRHTVLGRPWILDSNHDDCGGRSIR